MDPYFLANLTTGGQAQYNPLLACPTPPDSFSGANTPSPGGVQNGPASNGTPEDNINFNYTPHVSSPGPPTAAVTVGRAEVERRGAARRLQLTSACCSDASIKILNPKPEYDKVQKKHGPRGKISEQRIHNGQVRLKCTVVGETRTSAVFVIFS